MKNISTLFAFLFLISGCHSVSSPQAPKVLALDYDIIEIPSENFNSREGTPITYLIAHSIGFQDLGETIKSLIKDEKNGGLGVSAHYLVPQLTGREFQAQYPEFVKDPLNFPEKVPALRLVPDDKRAYHAGVSVWQDSTQIKGCEKGLNSASIGVEFHAPGYANGDGSDWFKFVPFNKKQLETGRLLFRDILNTHQIPSQNVLAHSDIAPFRFDEGKVVVGKTDPGPYFPWQEWARSGVGVWYKPFRGKLPHFKNKVAWVQERLKELGYATCPQTGVYDEATQNVVNAFRMHWINHQWQGPNQPIDEALLRVLYNTTQK